MKRFLKTFLFLIVSLFLVVSGVDRALDHLSRADTQNSFTAYSEQGTVVLAYQGDINGLRVCMKPGAVVTPLLLADAHHARIDIPRQIAACGVAVRHADVLGEDDRLVSVLHERLAELGVNTLDRQLGVLVVAIGSTHAAANGRTTQVADKLIAGTQWACATTAFATGSGPSLTDAATELRRRGARHVVIAPWFLAPGRLTDRIAQFAAAEGIPMAAPLGPHRLVAETVLERFAAGVAERIAA